MLPIEHRFIFCLFPLIYVDQSMHSWNLKQFTNTIMTKMLYLVEMRWYVDYVQLEGVHSNDGKMPMQNNKTNCLRNFVYIWICCFFLHRIQIDCSNQPYCVCVCSFISLT